MTRFPGHATRGAKHYTGAICTQSRARISASPEEAKAGELYEVNSAPKLSHLTLFLFRQTPRWICIVALNYGVARFAPWPCCTSSLRARPSAPAWAVLGHAAGCLLTGWPGNG